MAGAQAASPQNSGTGSSWEYQIDFNGSSLLDARQQVSSLTASLSNQGIVSELQALGFSNYRLTLTGSQGIEQIRQFIYSPRLASLIGGAAELEIDLPVSSLADITLTLESNLTTGYSWQVPPAGSGGITQVSQPKFMIRASGYGAPSVQTMMFRPEKLGLGSIKLVYRRPFEPNETASRHLHITLAAQTTKIDLSDPNQMAKNPQVGLTSPSGKPNPMDESLVNSSLPPSLDWRTLGGGIVPAIRDQGVCGSDWAFGTVGSMESAIAKVNGSIPDLSEQFLISCNLDGWSCDGGDIAHKYHFDTLAQNQTSIGAVLEADDPYTASDDICSVAYNHPYRLSGWQFVDENEWDVPSVVQIKNALYTYGPISAGVCAGPAFQAYTGGIFSTDESSSCGGTADHIIDLVGWDDAGQYWILRNSWGTGWGESGYMRITYNTSNVGFGAAWVIWNGGRLSGTVSNGSNGSPIMQALVEAADGGQTTSDSQGGYSLPMPAGVYTITASAYGFLPVTVNNISISSGVTTTQNFSLPPAPFHVVSGQVTDAGTGWPLYASIDIPGYPEVTVWTNPLTGAYSVSLPEERSFTFSVKSWSPGYTSSSRTVGPLTGDRTENFGLSADTSACSAPGYKVSGFVETFEQATPPALPDHWAKVDVSGSEGDWATHAGTVHPSGFSAHSGTNLAYFNSWSASAGSETRLYRAIGLDMTGLSGSTLTFWMYHDSEEKSKKDSLQVQVSTNGGGTWTNVGTAILRTDSTAGWKQHSVDLSAYASQKDLRLGFLGISDFGNDIHIDDVSVGTFSCEVQSGGLVVGNVYDANTNAPLVGATVSNDSGHSTTTRASNNLAVDDGFYILFSPAGSHTFTAAMSGSTYGNISTSVNVVLNSVVRQDFHLPSASLGYAPPTLQATLQLGSTTMIPFTLTNNGGLTATFHLREGNASLMQASGEINGQGTWLYRSETGIPMESSQGGVTLAYPSAYRWMPDTAATVNVLIYADDWVHAPPNTYLDQALRSMGVAYTAHYNADFSGFESDLASGTWFAVFYEGDSFNTPNTTLTALKTYVQGGGKLGAEIWDMLNLSTDPLFAALGVTYVNNYANPTPATHWWNPAHAIFTSPDSAPEWPSYTCPAFVTCGQYVDPVSGVSTALAGYTLAPASGQAALILRNDGKTVFKAFLDTANTDSDIDTDGIKDAVELWTNIADFLIYSDVPWLSEAPLSGSISAGNSQVVNVTFNAGAVLQNGQYESTLYVLSNDPVKRIIAVPVRMTVTGSMFQIYLPLVERQ